MECNKKKNWHLNLNLKILWYYRDDPEIKRLFKQISRRVFLKYEKRVVFMIIGLSNKNIYNQLIFRRPNNVYKFNKINIFN